MDVSVCVRFQPTPLGQQVEGGHQVAQVRFKPMPGDVSPTFLMAWSTPMVTSSLTERRA